MSNLIRSFIAIPLNQEIHKNLEDFSSRYELTDRSLGLKPVKPSNIHLTLKFLGEIDQVQATKLSSLLDKTAASLKPFQAKIHGVGAFPGWKSHPRVIFVQASPEESIKEVFHKVESAAVSLGFPQENREFSPHLTLARVAFHTPQLDNLISVLMRMAQEPQFGALPIDKIVMFKSVLLPQGPVYTVLSTHSFSASSELC